MQFFYWLIFLVAIALAVFAIQNSSSAPVTIKFLIWSFETSLIYTILGSIILGMVIISLLWISRAIKASFRSKTVKQEGP